MDLLKELSEKSVDDRERDLMEYWKDIDLLHLSITERNDAPPFIFYEGPPTANGRPGIHHVMARTLKDLTCRYKTMQGFQVKRKAGWDTHGLPVEIEVEKKLGLKNKQDIEKYGIKAFNKMCKDSVFEYEKEWRDMTERMAYLIDLDNPYITLDNNYIESVWWILNSMFEDGLLYEGHKILPYCSRCGTGLASHEVAQGYKLDKVETVYVKFKRKDADEYFLVWTTTPWTLPSNVLLTVHPDVTYVRVKNQGETYILAKALVDEVIKDDYEIVDEFLGKDLEYVEYEQLLPFLQADKKAFFVTLADYVTTDSGTGVVHTAPAFGEDDYNTGRRYDAPVLNPVDDKGQFTDTPWKGMFVMDADHEILHYLYDNNILYRKQKIEHNYPHCWRCDTPLIYYAKPSWYIKVTDFKEKLIANNNEVNWYPSFVGEKRFGNWLENLNDWAISRSRYWGTPLPVWRCNDCGHISSVGSRKDLVERAIEDIAESIELHRPYVDDVHLKCDKCGGTMTREEDVIDVWFDSGAMPFAQHHYPFENKENFDELFPADFINEGIDQTRGWFYSLLAIATYVKGKSPYKNVLVNDLILDKEGKKMSKSRGNTVNPIELFEKYGADALRYYLVYVSPPWTPTKFNEEDIKEVQSKFFGTIRNIYNFLSLYANTDEIDLQSFNIPYEERPEIDRWLLSKYNNLVKEVTDAFDHYDVNKVVKIIQDFLVEDFSNWYIRRNRRRFWKEDLDTDKKAVYNTTYEVLLGLVKMVAPITPFIAEELYRNLTNGKTVHLEKYPKVNEDLIDTKLEEKMDLVRKIVSLGRVSRENAQIKVRQPLPSVVIDGSFKDTIGNLTDLIKEELNVKEVNFGEDITEYMNYSLKPNFKVAGSILGSKIKLFAKYLQEVKAKDFIDKLRADGKVLVNLDGEDVEIIEDYVLINIEGKEGFDVSHENNVYIILDTHISQELKDEGFVREVISKIQQLRKQADFDVLDKIKVYIQADDEIKSALSKDLDYLKTEVLADEVIFDEAIEEKYNINGLDTGIKVQRI
ncbi:isoleucine--tRNA ligase [Neofamilia massiliensis]|uniref:isoleucine--tRNA ligase n=1 Tax=Neofamilia massiliensis TaxID=1673724 RepID=UPI00096AD367|nr:isoleucine--tRNA ligase [Neofamilia massiliensis]